ncbi:hypothetical protein QTI33_19530 [Variovorax sp. J22P271]|uniref:phthiocerol/phthiodiolone dimycocerosyl transferase family protein n=1 Tax=Variovorax davisae TaxID=3053515 RepID=UPI00257516F8|nr:hypothetical protein [Variovorax sp. J22P271]MDM0034336.1 hypothetical protein [Variovorax sp. J22P271]
MAWSRPLDPAEAFFVRLDRVSRMNFVVRVDCDEVIDSARLRVALDQVQHEDRLLAVAITKVDQQLIFEWQPGRAIPIEVLESSRDQWDRMAERQLSSKFEAGDAPLLHALLLHDRACGWSSLTLTFHHAIADGRCAGELCRRILDAMAGDARATPSASLGAADCGAVPADLLPLHEGYPEVFRPPQCNAVERRIEREWALQAYRSGPPTPLPWFADHPGPFSPKIHRLRISEHDWRDLAAQCRRRNASVHGLFCAIQLLALHEILGADASHNLLIFSAVDLRGRLATPAPLRPVQLHASNLYNMYTLHERTELWELAKMATVLTRAQLDRGDAHLFYRRREVARFALPNPQTDALRWSQQTMEPRGSVLSTVGQFRGFAPHGQVRNVSLAIAPARNQACCTMVSSVNGRPDVCVICDDANLRPGLREQLVQSQQRVLDRAVQACGEISP